ncbi:MAG TPA: MYXO-CTERM sorting domain-containing protein, partial [Myxococcaceae bacterium]|nr:MYXO-CTERM sorting domain-containing protein [Myxococcaceae bacterium]
LAAAYPNNGSAVGSPCDGQSGSPTACQGGLRCATPVGNDPWGTPWRKMCTQQCTPTGVGACPIPYACVRSDLFAVGGYACLPNTGNDITQVGHACTQATIGPDCQSAFSVCDAQATLPSGAPEWPQGYCSQNCAAAGGTPCPNGSECVQTRTSVYQCLKSCRTGYADCRQGYTCAALAGVHDGVCITKCGGDVDCGGTNPFCRTCDGLCFTQNKPTGVIGDPCTTTADCGAAQICYTGFTWTTTGKGVCTQPCGTVCSACPNGSACVALPYSGGSLLCMRDCVPGSCAPGQQCLSLGGSRACVPSCTATSCPPGQTCQLGQCMSSSADAGTCDLCYAGGNGGGTLPDGGTGPGNPDPGGCGCQSAGATGAAILFALAFLLTRRARRAWPRP